MVVEIKKPLESIIIMGKKNGRVGGGIKYQYLRLDYVLKQTMFKMHKEVSLESRDR